MNISDFSSRGFLNTTPELVNFIRIYRSYPCLWNIRSEDYKRNDLKNRAVQEISEMYGVPVELVKKKIHSLRCTYNKELKKIRDSKFKSNGEGPIYHTSLVWFNEMNFLQDIITPRKSWLCDNPLFGFHDSQDGQDNSQDWQDSQEFPDTEDVKDEHCNNNNNNNVPESETESENVPVQAQTFLSNLIPSRQPMLNIIGPQYARLLDKTRFAPYKRPHQTGFEFDIFGASVAAQLREMDLCQAIETMAELQTILSSRRVQDITAKRSKTPLNTSGLSSTEPQSSTTIA